jgi:hypothetical protein
VGGLAKREKKQGERKEFLKLRQERQEARASEYAKETECPVFT